MAGSVAGHDVVGARAKGPVGRLGQGACRPSRWSSDIAYAGSVQLSQNARQELLNGRPSRIRGNGVPFASTPLRVTWAPSAGINTEDTPYGRASGPTLG